MNGFATPFALYSIPDPVTVSVSVYTGHTLQCTLCIYCGGASVEREGYPETQCTVLVHAQCAISVPSVHCQCTSSIH